MTNDTIIVPTTIEYPVDTIYTIDISDIFVAEDEIPVIMVVKGQIEEDGKIESVVRIVRFMAPATAKP